MSLLVQRYVSRVGQRRRQDSRKQSHSYDSPFDPEHVASQGYIRFLEFEVVSLTSMSVQSIRAYY